MFDNVVRNKTISVLGELHETLLGKYPDVFAFSVCLLHAAVLGKYRVIQSITVEKLSRQICLSINNIRCNT